MALPLFLLLATALQLSWVDTEEEQSLHVESLSSSSSLLLGLSLLLLLSSYTSHLHWFSEDAVKETEEEEEAEELSRDGAGEGAGDLVLVLPVCEVLASTAAIAIAVDLLVRPSRAVSPTTTAVSRKAVISFMALASKRASVCVHRLFGSSSVVTPPPKS